MSVWNDIRKQSAGKQMRQEDSIISGEEIRNNLSEPKPIVMVRTVDANGIPANYVPQEGHLVYVTEDCDLGRAGDMKLYMNGSWHTVSNITEATTVSAELRVDNPAYISPIQPQYFATIDDHKI